MTRRRVEPIDPRLQEPVERDLLDVELDPAFRALLHVADELGDEERIAMRLDPDRDRPPKRSAEQVVGELATLGFAEVIEEELLHLELRRSRLLTRFRGAPDRRDDARATPSFLQGAHELSDGIL